LSKAKIHKELGKDKIKRAPFDGFPDVVRMDWQADIEEESRSGSTTQR
jgi:hypothetical protein